MSHLYSVLTTCGSSEERNRVNRTTGTSPADQPYHCYRRFAYMRRGNEVLLLAKWYDKLDSNVRIQCSSSSINIRFLPEEK